MSAMRDMSRAIRHELNEYGPTMRDVPADVLREFKSIVGAFYADIVDELEQRARFDSGPASRLPERSGER